MEGLTLLNRNHKEYPSSPENAKLELNYEIVTDFSKACEIKQNAVQAEKKGIHLLRENDKIYGLGIAFGTELYVMKQEGFISEGFLLETMDEVLKSQNVFLFGLKVFNVNLIGR